MAVVTSGLNYLKGSEPFVGRDLYVVAQALFADQGKEIIDILVELGAMKRSYDKEAEQSSMSPTNQAEKPKRQERKDHGNEKGAGTAHSKSSLPLLGVKVGRHDQGRLPSCSRPSESGGERLVLRSRRPKNPLLQVGSPPHILIRSVINAGCSSPRRALIMARSQHFRVSFSQYRERYSNEVLVLQTSPSRGLAHVRCRSKCPTTAAPHISSFCITSATMCCPRLKPPIVVRSIALPLLWRCANLERFSFRSRSAGERGSRRYDCFL